MTVLAIALGSALLYVIAYFTYGRWLGQKIFRLSSSQIAPSVELEDGQDYVPTKKAVVFGHHFTSIAGTGPIVGPALAVIWGWLPALLWVLFGSIFIGAVHDFGSLVVSMRNRGQTVGDIAGQVFSPRARLLFLGILFLALTIVLALFGLVIAIVFRIFPQAILPCLIQVPIALGIGLVIHRRGGSLLIPSIVALALMYLSIAFGNLGPLAAINGWLASQSNLWWVVVLLTYSAVASVLPVWTLLQPRDFINSLQLLSALGLTLIGLVAASFIGGAPPVGGGGTRPALELAAPALAGIDKLADLPLIFPFLFITIACGAISGFHCLVSSGTSSKQLRCETDARFVGFGSMLTEGFLAVIVILACVAGLGLGAPEMISGKTTGDILTGTDIYQNRYASWTGTAGLPAKLAAFVDGSANFLKAIGLPASLATALMGVFVASFAATTLDTACRLQRYVVQELAASIAPSPEGRNPVAVLKNKYAATIFLVIVAFGMAAIPATPGGIAGTGGMILWPLFGATNQLLGGLAFLVVLFWMRARHMPVWFVVPPAIFMLVLPAWALLYQIFYKSISGGPGWLASGNILLTSVAVLTLALEAFIISAALKKLRSGQTEVSPV